jgi:hypothetical protein
MKKILLITLLSLIFIHFMYQSEGPSIWTQSLSGAGQIWGVAVAPSSQQIIYAASNSQGMWKSTNAGLNWVQINSGLDNLILQCCAVSQTNANIVMCGSTNTGTNPGVYRSTNGGTSWTRGVTGITETAINIQQVAIDPVNPNIAYIAVFDGATNSTNGIYKSTDGGATWTPITNGIGTIKNFLAIAVNPLNPNVIYAGTSFSPPSTGPAKIYKSVNGGALWTDMSNGLPSLTTDLKPVRQISISRTDTSVVLAGLFINTDTLGGGMYVTANGGGLWQKRNNGLPVAVGLLPRSCIIRNGSSNEFFVGLGNATNTNIGVYRTTNSGVSWASFNNGVMVNTYTIRAFDFKTTGDTTIFAGVAHPTLTTGQGVFEYSWPPVGINDPNSELPKEFSLFQNFPNPFNPTTVVKFAVPKSSYVIVTVYDVSGKTVRTLVNEQKPAGYHQVMFNAEGLSSGVYFYSLKALDASAPLSSSFTQTRKMILIK